MKFLRTFSAALLFFSIGTSDLKAQNIPSWKIDDLQNYIEKSDSILVVNFWATFCKPCVEEIPYLQSISNKYKNKKVKLVLVSLDFAAFYPDKIKTFSLKNNYTSKIVWLNETNADLFCPKIDKAWSGGIPATYIINSKTGYKKFVEAQMKPDEFERELKKAL